MLNMLPFNNSKSKKSIPELDTSNKIEDMLSTAMLQMLKSFAILNENPIDDLSTPNLNIS